MTIKVNSKIKLNPSMFESYKGDDAHHGQLGYAGIMKDWFFEVVSFGENHSYHGQMLECKVLNVAGVKGNIFLRLDECVPAVQKLTVTYELFPNVLESNALDLELQSLNVEKELALSSGKYKLGGRKLTALEKQISEVRNKIDNIPDQVYIPKLKMFFHVPRSISNDKAQLESACVSFIRDIRKIRNTPIQPKTKIVMDNFTVKLVGGVHVQPNVYGEIFEKRIIELFDKPKVPTDVNANYVGVEIECLIKSGSKTTLKKLLAKARLHNNINLGSDSSIQRDTSGYDGIELRVLAKESELESVLLRLHKVLRNRKVDAYANRSCGLHVHLDQRNRSVAHSYENLFKVQKLLRYSQPTSRLESSYCKPMTSSTFVDAMDVNERYGVINVQAYNKFKTLEVRVHEGTINALEIIKWCNFLIGVISPKTNLTSDISNVDQLSSMTHDIPQVSIGYISSRMEEFGSDEEVA